MNIDKRCIKTEKTIKKTFIELLKTNSYHDISIKLLCEKSIISKNTFYSHYKSKEELLTLIINELLNELLIVFKKNHTSKYTNTQEILISDLIEIVNHFEKNKNIYVIFFQHDHEINISSIICKNFINHTLHWTKLISDENKVNFKTRLILNCCTTTSVQFIKDWLIVPNNISKEEITDLFIKAIYPSVKLVADFGFGIKS